MNKRKLFIGAGAAILAFAAIFTTKASNKFAAAVYYLTGGSNHCKVLTSTLNSTYFTTTGTDQATIKTSGGTSETLWASSACNSIGGEVFFKGN